MKPTGIVRRIDDLGRVVIPKEIRRTMRIREKDPLEIFTDRNGKVILKKYSPIGELGDYAQQSVESLHDALGHVVLVADHDVYIAVAGTSKNEYEERRVGEAVEKAKNAGATVVFNRPQEEEWPGPLVGIDEDKDKYAAYLVAPIMVEDEPIGAVVLFSKERGTRMQEAERKAAEATARFLAIQMQK